MRQRLFSDLIANYQPGVMSGFSGCMVGLIGSGLLDENFSVSANFTGDTAGILTAVLPSRAPISTRMVGPFLPGF
jgi:hypothetical protein